MFNVACEGGGPRGNHGFPRVQDMGAAMKLQKLF